MSCSKPTCLRSPRVKGAQADRRLCQAVLSLLWPVEEAWAGGWAEQLRCPSERVSPVSPAEDWRVPHPLRRRTYVLQSCEPKCEFSGLNQGTTGFGRRRIYLQVRRTACITQACRRTDGNVNFVKSSRVQGPLSS